MVNLWNASQMLPIEDDGRQENASSCKCNIVSRDEIGQDHSSTDVKYPSFSAPSCPERSVQTRPRTVHGYTKGIMGTNIWMLAVLLVTLICLFGISGASKENHQSSPSSVPLASSSDRKPYESRVFTFKMGNGGKSMTAVVDAIKKRLEQNRNSNATVPSLLSDILQGTTVANETSNEAISNPKQPPATVEEKENPPADGTPILSTDASSDSPSSATTQEKKKVKSGKRLRESPIYYIKMNPLLPPPPPPPSPHSPFLMLQGLHNLEHNPPQISTSHHYGAPLQHQHNHHQQQLMTLSRSPSGMLQYLPLNFRANGKPSVTEVHHHNPWALHEQSVHNDAFSFSNLGWGGFGDYHQPQQQSPQDLWFQQQQQKQRLMHQQHYQAPQQLESNVINLPLDFRINGQPHSVYLPQPENTFGSQKRPKISSSPFINMTPPTTTTTTTTTTPKPPAASQFPDAFGRNSPVHNLRNKYYFNGKPSSVFVFKTLKRYPYLYHSLRDLL